MPEIAEVRTVKSTLNKNIVGRKIIGIETPYDKIIMGDKEEFISSLLNKKITQIDNCGKWLIFKLDDISFISHLRMEGKYYIKNKNEIKEKHEHIIFHLDNGMDLRYKDVRKFGKMKLVPTDKIYEINEIKKLGIEPDSKNLTISYLYEKLNKSNKTIKEILLDQTVVNGLGNIYVDEILFSAKINPSRKSKSINKAEVERIIKSSKKIITEATLMKGTTIRTYTSSLGVKGKYQEKLKVHTKEGQKCPVCKNKIIKTRVGGRGTYYCAHCQK